MRVPKSFFIFYIYLLEKMEKKDSLAKSITPVTSESQFTFTSILKDIGISALTAFVLYQLMVFLHMGYFIFPDYYALIEMGLLFVFLLSLFWMHRGISNFMEMKFLKDANILRRTMIEIVVVILSTIVLTLIVTYFPSVLIFPPEAILPERVRVAFIVTITISLFFYFFVERERSKRHLQGKMLLSARLQKENFQAQLQSLRSQVNPHFLFNSLNILNSLIKRNEEEAREFVRRLSKVYRSFLEQSDKQLVALQKEMELAEAYIYLLRIRFGNSISFEITILPNKMKLLLPPGSLQMLIENAIKHNGSTRKKPLLIEIFSEENQLVVKNNLQPRLDEVKSSGTGLQNICRRYAFLSDEQVEFKKSTTAFIAKIPLLKAQTDENNHH